MVRPRLILVGIALVVGSLAQTRTASAQIGYYPPGGTLSPWLNMFNRNPGSLGNYNTYVRPQLELQKTVAQQNAAMQRQGSQIQSLALGMADSQREATIPATGTGATFMNYSHYYPQKGMGGGRVASRSGMR